MAKDKPGSKRRSGCPLNASVEVLGDRWSLLIIRDMMLRGFRSYKEFLESYERLATNILADRLRRLEFHDIIRAEQDPLDGRRLNYALTEKGIDLAPVLTEMVLWAGAHERTENQELIQRMRKDKQKFLEEIREKWDQQRESSRTVTGSGTRDVTGSATERHTQRAAQRATKPQR